MFNEKEKILLVGTGNIARDYVKVLRDLDVNFIVIGRSPKSVELFMEDTGIQAFKGGVRQNRNLLKDVAAAIVAIDTSQLAEVANFLMDNGIRRLLIEKPGGISQKSILHLTEKAESTNSEVYIAYNRRFYESVFEAEKIIENDGGVKSFHFEFTEWPHKIMQTGLPEETIRNWFICNSTHVIDLAFFLGGKPSDIACFYDKKADWTNDYICYTGAGVSKNGALFDYCANWNAPGRWNLEFMTNKHRLIFRPVESLKIQKLKTVEIKEADTVDYIFDSKYKPGLYRQVKTFLEKDKTYIPRMKTVKEQLEMWTIFEKISGRKY